MSGDRQRRCLAKHCSTIKLILADEFLGELDKENVESIIKATKKLISEIGAT